MQTTDTGVIFSKNKFIVKNLSVPKYIYKKRECRIVSSNECFTSNIIQRLAVTTKFIPACTLRLKIKV